MGLIKHNYNKIKAVTLIKKWCKYSIFSKNPFCIPKNPFNQKSFGVQHVLSQVTYYYMSTCIKKSIKAPHVYRAICWQCSSNGLMEPTGHMMEVNSINTLPAVTSSLLAETCQQSKQSCLNNILFILCYCLKVVVCGIYQHKVSFRIKAVQQECLLMILFIWMYTSLATAQ